MDVLNFVELRPFTRTWSDLELDDERDLAELQLEIMAAPRHWPVVKGTGGLRKMRFAPTKWRRGKSGALRVCYVYFEAHGIILLAIVYPKSEQDDLSDDDKATIRHIVERIEKQLQEGRWIE
jgi:hypothetical protein